MRLSAEQVDQFFNQGYLVVENVLGPQVMEPVRAEYADLLDRLVEGWIEGGALEAAVADLDFWGKLLAAYKAGCDWFQPMDISLPGDTIHADTPFHFGPAVFDMLTAPALLDVVGSLIGDELTSNPIQHVRIKPPAPDLHADEVRAHITATDWHQDRGVTHEEADATEMVTVWIAVTDATVENGCLQVVPQSGLTDLAPHCLKTQTAIADGFLDETQAVPLPVNAGGVVLFHPLTPHASLVNRTDGFRWSFDVRFNKTGQPTGRSHFPDFIARSASNPASELRDWEKWRAMWEDARARLSTQPHKPIHRWTHDGPYCA